MRAAFETFVLTLPATSIVVQWGNASVAKVGDKVFGVFGMAETDGARIDFKVAPMSFEILTALAGITQAPYFARGHWVAVAVDSELPESDLEAYLRAAHRLVASKLTRKARAELRLAP